MARAEGDEGSYRSYGTQPRAPVSGIFGIVSTIMCII